MPQPIVVFDLDGTLVDTAPDLIAAINHAVGTAGLEPADAVALRAYVGHGGKAMIERVFAQQRRALSATQGQQLLDTFIEHYSASMPGLSQPYPGVIEALDRLSAAGLVLAVCTNKLERLALKLMQGLTLVPRFAAICGADTFDVRKPDPRHLLMTIERAGGDPAAAVMVGDSETDIEVAKRAGVPVVAVDFGYTDRHVRDFEPSRVISHFDALTVDLVRKLIAAAA